MERIPGGARRRHGVDGTVPANPYEAVRIDWPTEGQPGWKITDDVAFIGCREADDLYNRLRERKLTENDAATLTQETHYTRAWAIRWVIYGPSSFDNARKIRSGLFLETNRRTLRKGILSLVPAVAAPMRVPENFQGQWWERADLRAMFYEAVTEETTVDVIESATVTIIQEPGDVTRTMTVNAD